MATCSFVAKRASTGPCTEKVAVTYGQKCYCADHSRTVQALRAKEEYASEQAEKSKPVSGIPAPSATSASVTSASATAVAAVNMSPPKAAVNTENSPLQPVSPPRVASAKSKRSAKAKIPSPPESSESDSDSDSVSDDDIPSSSVIETKKNMHDYFFSPAANSKRIKPRPRERPKRNGHHHPRLQRKLFRNAP